MTLPIAWVDRIFDKLTITYGREFIGRWEGLSIPDVKTDWGHELARLQGWPEAIAFGLDHLPAKPPTVIQFRELCLQAPAKQNLALPAPQANPERMKAEISKLRESMTQPSKKLVRDRDWAHRILNRQAAGEKISPAVIRMAKDGLAN